MNDLIIRGLENPRVLAIPNSHRCAGCQHQQHEEEETKLVPKTVIRINSEGYIENNTDKRRELWEKFEKDLGLEEKLNPMDEPVVARVLSTQGIVTRELER